MSDTSFVAAELDLHDRWSELKYVVDHHEGQVDKAGNDYVEAHLLDVARLVPRKLRLLALSHDLLEDCKDASLQGMEQAGFTFEERMIVLSLTKTEGVPLNEYIDCVKLFPESITIKVADIVSNLSRLGNLDKPAQERLKVKYYKTLKLLLDT